MTELPILAPQTSFYPKPEQKTAVLQCLTKQMHYNGDVEMVSQHCPTEMEAFHPSILESTTFRHKKWKNKSSTLPVRSTGAHSTKSSWVSECLFPTKFCKSWCCCEVVWCGWVNTSYRKTASAEIFQPNPTQTPYFQRRLNQGEQTGHRIVFFNRGRMKEERWLQNSYPFRRAESTRKALLFFPIFEVIS